MTTSTGIAHHRTCPVGRWLRLPCVVRDERPACTCPPLTLQPAREPTFEEWLAGRRFTQQPHLEETR